MRRLFLALVVLAVVGACAFWFLSAPRLAVSSADAAALETGGNADKGRLIFVAGGCASCHATPGQDDRTKLGGGRTLGSPFGAFHVPNISSDPQDGIGRWSTADLANAMLSGVSPDGSHLYPAFPYTSYAHMTLDDVRDLRAYLKTVPAVAGRAPPHELPFPFTIRRGIGLWKLLFLDRTPITPDPAQNPAWNRGRYLVEALGHCAECHSSRNILGAIDPATRFAGGPDLEGHGFVPNITPGRIGSWSQADLVEVLTSGMTPDFDSVGSSMADVVRNTAALPQADREAIATYIKALPSRPTPPRPAAPAR